MSYLPKWFRERGSDTLLQRWGLENVSVQKISDKPFLEILIPEL